MVGGKCKKVSPAQGIENTWEISDLAGSLGSIPGGRVLSMKPQRRTRGQKDALDKRNSMGQDRA